MNQKQLWSRTGRAIPLIDHSRIDSNIGLELEPGRPANKMAPMNLENSTSNSGLGPHRATVPRARTHGVIFPDLANLILRKGKWEMRDKRQEIDGARLCIRASGGLAFLLVVACGVRRAETTSPRLYRALHFDVISGVWRLLPFLLLRLLAAPHLFLFSPIFSKLKHLTGILGIPYRILRIQFRRTHEERGSSETATPGVEPRAPRRCVLRERLQSKRMWEGGQEIQSRRERGKKSEESWSSGEPARSLKDPASRSRPIPASLLIADRIQNRYYYIWEEIGVGTFSDNDILAWGIIFIFRHFQSGLSFFHFPASITAMPYIDSELLDFEWDLMTELLLQVGQVRRMSVQAREIKIKRGNPRRIRSRAPETVQVRRHEVQVRCKPKYGQPSDGFMVE
ncbi:hypothetical protein B0H13DRAFT_1856596 [Mycena leptocephala]|nr:hypothetical protein B0H13DRAFT_1856596 [Mycena leptocephala]